MAVFGSPIGRIDDISWQSSKHLWQNWCRSRRPFPNRTSCATATIGSWPQTRLIEPTGSIRARSLAAMASRCRIDTPCPGRASPVRCSAACNRASASACCSALHVARRELRKHRAVVDPRRRRRNRVLGVSSRNGKNRTLRHSLPKLVPCRRCETRFALQRCDQRARNISLACMAGAHEL